MSYQRPDDALLAGACAELARRLGWNVWVLRALFVLGLFIKPLWTGLAYGALAVLTGLLAGEPDSKSGPPGGLNSRDLEARGRRIAELEKQFRDLERR